MSQEMELICESLLLCMSIYERCLSFDFNAILLNESLDDPSSTNIPQAWRPLIVENP